MARIIIDKAQRLLTLISEEETVRMRVALGREPEGHKRMEGDGKTPEGDYYVCTRNAQSKYHLALGLSYPNARDAETALRTGLITPAQYGQIALAERQEARPPWDTPLGGYIMIHGGGTDSDWTQGCVALADADIERLWLACPLGTKVTIAP